jgi:hypothetical protein
MNSHRGKENYRWFFTIAGIFVTVLITSNIIAVKIVNFFGLFLPAAVILFPVTYIIGDILTEVYGYARARKVIWLGFFCNSIVVIAIWIAGLLPAAPFWNAGLYESQKDAVRAYQAILGFTPRLLAASFIAYIFGEFLNSFVLAKMKIMTRGKFLWMRTIGSTFAGQAADSSIFITIAFAGVLPSNELIRIIFSQWFIKVLYEALATPLTYVVVDRLKRIENEDYFDIDTNFSPIVMTRKR